MFAEEIACFEGEIAKEADKRERLKELDLFVLDNSIRESTVGQLRGHTLENKMKIYSEVKECGIKAIIVASFAHMTRVDDVFVQDLVANGEDLSWLFAFSEITESIKDGDLDREKIPIALTKMKLFGLRNPIFEIDLVDYNVHWEDKFTTDDMCTILNKLFQWSVENLDGTSKILVNLRDFPFAMKKAPERVLTIVQYLCSLRDKYNLLGIIYEEPTGKFLPDEMGAWTASVRRTMDKSGWTSGKLLVHVHEKWGLADTVQLECLNRGANGVWASLCEEGAAMGHACSTITLMNLVRMGNKKVLKRYNCTYLRTAATKITEITTGTTPHPKQVVYGDRSADLTFDFGGIAGGHIAPGDFDIAAFFGVKPPLRISTLASVTMIKTRLIDLFGQNPQFNEEMALKMKELMIKDLTENRKEEYMSHVGIALLFDRAGGKLTEKMSDAIFNMKLHSSGSEELIRQVREIWDEWDLRDEKQNDDALQFDSFYNGFMSPYFGCYRCEDTQKGLKAIDMDQDNLIDWKEFLVYIKWALHEYPNIADVDELLSITFRKGIIPAMRDETISGIL